jgi:hypothetical protein
MNYDLTRILQSWAYQPGQVAARRFKGRDGQQKIQLRVDLGVLQMNALGRPDGKRPLGHESWFEAVQQRLADHRKEHGNDDDFELTPEECGKLQQESIQYHHRYICHFQLDDFASVEQDCERNLKVFSFVAEFAPSEDTAWSLLQFIPQLLMMRTRARGTAALKQQRFDDALMLIGDGIAELERFYQENERPQLLENSAELASLREWYAQVGVRRPMSAVEKLERDLAEAIRVEDYERAALVRDALRKHQSSES